jgi:hypothetical protein
MQGVFMLIGLVFVLGWILPLVQGIVRIRAGGKGTWLIAFACVWAFVAIGIASLGVCVYVAVRNRLVSEELDMAAYGGPTGTIVSPYRGESTLIVVTGGEDREQVKVISNNGRFVVPAGQVEVSFYEARKGDRFGVRWKAYTVSSGSTRKHLVVPANGECVLDMGEPLTARINARRNGEGGCSMSFEVKDRNGAAFALDLVEGVAPGEFQATDSSGKVVWTDTFPYG